MAERPRVAAHRGGALLWPENSLRAFTEALALGVDLLELDVHATADGGIAVIHDPTLERTTDGRGPVAAVRRADLARLRLRGPDGALTGEPVPTLEAVLERVAPGPAGLLVEIKGPAPGPGVAWERRDGEVVAVPGPRYPGLEERVLAALDRAGMSGRTTIMAFNPEVIAAVRRLAPAQRTTLLVAEAHVRLAGARPEDTVAWAARAGAADVGLQHPLVTAAVVAAARAAGLTVGAWTVNDERVMRRLVAVGVDVLTSDRPDLALAVVRRR